MKIVAPRVISRGCRRLALLLILALVVVSPAAAGDAVASDSGEEATQGRGRVLVVFPSTEFYPLYIADPLRAQSALMLLRTSSSEIPDAGEDRFLLRLGGRFAILRIHPAGEPDRGWQLDFHGGFFGLFDRDNSLDNIGWDGLYGLKLSLRPGGPLSFCVGTRHDSAHVGDEYAEETGRLRIDSTREELIVGLSWEVTRRWRVYAEGGYGFGLESFQEPLRAQLGVEHLGRRRLWSSRTGWYAALDATLYEERDWQLNTAAQVGLVVPIGQGASRYRFALEIVSGRAVLGEFSFHDETYVGLGWYFDF